jgi:excisionase family DNA binding protein
VALVQDSWLTLDEAAELMSVSVGRVRRLIGEQRLAAVRIDGQLRMPRDFVYEGKPLPELRGTLIALSDAGFTPEEAVGWLVTENPELETVPLDALCTGRGKQVRWNIQTLG